MGNYKPRLHDEVLSVGSTKYPVGNAIVEELTLDEFIDVVKEPTPKGIPNLSVEGNDKHWYATDSFEDAVKLMEYGWAEGVKKASGKFQTMNIPTSDMSIEPEPVIAEEGEDVLIDHFLDGEDEHFMGWKERFQSSYGRVARLVVNVTASGSFGADQLISRGVMIIGLVDALERSGIRCEISAVENITNNGNFAMLRLLLKRAEDPLEIDRIAYVIGHPSFLRRHIFRWNELSENLGKDSFKKFYGGWGYGSPCDVPDFIKGDDRTIYFEQASSAQVDEKQMLERCQKIIDKWLVPVGAEA